MTNSYVTGSIVEVAAGEVLVGEFF